MRSIIFILLLSSFFSSCNFSQGVKKDLNTGLSASYNGFAIDDIYLASEGQRLNSNSIAMGSKINITVTGVENFVVKDGKVYPGCTIILTDKAGKEILNLPDAFSEMKEGTTTDEAKTLQASLNTGNPMAVDDTYHLNVRFFDKNKKRKRNYCQYKPGDEVMLCFTSL